MCAERLDTVKDLVLEVVRTEYRKVVARVGQAANQGRQIEVGVRCFTQLRKLGFSQWELENLLREAMWELVRQGLAYPYSFSGSVDGWTIWLTTRGAEALCNEGHPGHPRFIQGLVELGLSSTALLYLEEALQSSASPTATVMMASVGAEAVMLDLMAAYCSFLAHQNPPIQATKLQHSLVAATPVSQKIKVFVDDVKQRWDSLGSGVKAPTDIVQALTLTIASNRNAAGHPTGTKFAPDEAEVHLTMVRVQARKALEWMQLMKTSTTPQQVPDPTASPSSP